MKHAEIQIGEYTVPLIGIPTYATEYTCDECKKDKFQIQEVHLNYSGNKFLCQECRIKEIKQ